MTVSLTDFGRWSMPDLNSRCVSSRKTRRVGHRHLQGLHKVKIRQSNGHSNLPGSLAGHSPSPCRRLPPLWLWGGVLDRLAADHSGLHSRNPICALCAGCFIDS
ncbi:hypothetical protein CK203_024002 [Vitis vinifera]|uniref:Uncharacterized protein n=1 Tax=Vitis vinifera TaxID=29760 RepID=A0A438IPR5_VITVI|nr:hypothetical protein CK203_024002 [Vitis vinifera]